MRYVGTDWSAEVVPIPPLRWYRFMRYDGTVSPILSYMQSKVDEILKIAYGGAQPNISASIIGNFDFPLPPYKEQIRIVETVQRIFDQLDVITESL